MINFENWFEKRKLPNIYDYLDTKSGKSDESGEPPLITPPMYHGALIVVFGLLIYLSAAIIIASSSICSNFWYTCFFALAVRFFLYAIGYKHKTCTILGLIVVVLSYIFVWFGLVDTHDEPLTPFWMRLLWGLLL